jgi:hypothetical protein
VANQLFRERRTAKIIFWFLIPIFFAGFVRFYLAVFNLLYGVILTIIFGDKSLGVIATISFISSVAFSIATCSLLWKQYKKYILEGWYR